MSNLSKKRRKKIITLDVFARYLAFAMTVMKDKDNKVRLSKVISFLGKKGMFVTLFIFALPLSLPLPFPPGVPTIMSFPLLFISFQITLGRKKMYLPHFVSHYKLNTIFLAKACRKSARYLRFLNKISTPRLHFFVSGFAKPFAGFIALIFAIFVFLPLPGSNFFPAIGISMISVGVVLEDGLFVLTGLLVGLIGIVLSCIFGYAIVLASIEAIKYVVANIAVDNNVLYFFAGMLSGTVLIFCVSMFFRLFRSKK